MCDRKSSTANKVKDDGFENKLANRLYELYSQDRMFDVTFVTKDKRLSAHSIVIMASSNYLNDLFFASIDPSINKEITLNQISSESLSPIIQFCYTGEIQFESKTVTELVSAAGFLQIDFIIRAACEFMINEINEENCIQFEEIARSYNYYRLQSAVHEFITKHFNAIYKTKSFLEVPYEGLMNILKSEIDVSDQVMFSSIKSWVEHDKSNRSKHLNSLLKIIRLPSLSAQTIFDEVQPLCDGATDCQNVIFQALLWKQIPNRRAEITGTNWNNKLASGKTIITTGSLYAEVAGVIDIYNPIDKIWVEYLDTGVKHTNACWLKFGDELYVIGGADRNITNKVVTINLKTGKKDNFAPLNLGRNSAAATIFKGIPYIFGGYSNERTTATVEKYNPLLNKWEYTTPMPTPRSGAAIAVVYDEIYLIGGWHNAPVNGEVNYEGLNSMEAFCPTTKKWRRCPPMQEHRDWTTATVFNNKIYVIGGRPFENRFGETSLNTVEVYDPENDSWSYIAKMNFRLYGCSAGVLDNNIVVAGGADGYRAVNNFIRYNVEMNQWEDLANLIRSRENGFIFQVPLSFLDNKFS